MSKKSPEQNQSFLFIADLLWYTKSLSRQSSPGSSRQEAPISTAWKDVLSNSSGGMGHPQGAQAGTAVIQPSQMHKLKVKHLLTDHK